MPARPMWCSAVATPPVTLDLTNLTAAQGFIIQGDVADDRAGCSVSSAGDVNGDGFDDLIVGAPYGDNGGSNAGEAYVIFGGVNPVNIDLTTLTVDQGIVIQGGADDGAGSGVSSAGDVNGDGFDDLIIGAVFAGDGGINANEGGPYPYVFFGEAYVVFGGASPVSIDLTTLTAAQGFRMLADAYDGVGRSVASAGDVNGDGFDDLIVGAYHSRNGGYSAGQAYVVFGGVNLVEIDFTTLTAAQGFIIQGDAAYDILGYSVSSAGDVNGDGFDDLILGAPHGDNGGTDAGEAYVVFGGAFGLGSTPVTTTGTTAAEMLIGGLGNDILTGGGGADVLRGGAGDDVLGVSDANFADINGGTGIDTVRLDGSSISLDLVTMLPAKIQSIEIIDLTGTGNNSLSVDRLSLLDLSEERSGGVAMLTVSGDAGDAVNLGSGWLYQGSIAVGVENYERYSNGNAELRIQDGVTVDIDTAAPAVPTIDLDAASDTGASDTDDITSDTTPTLTGTTEADALVEVYDDVTLLGNTTANGSGNWSFTTGVLTDGLHNFTATATDTAGNVSAASTVLAVTIAIEDTVIDTAAPAVPTIDLDAASDTGASDTDDITSDTTPTLTGTTEADALVEVYDDATLLGNTTANGSGNWSFTTGVLTDGLHNFTATATDTAGNVSAASTVLAVTIAIERTVIDLGALAASEGFVIKSVAYDYRGGSVASAGDINGDGFDDVIVGDPNGDQGESSGLAYVVMGAASPENIDLSGLAPPDGIVVQGNRIGWNVSNAGDVNGDGLDDLIVGAPLANYNGQAHVVFGAASPANVDLATMGVEQGFTIQGDYYGDYAGWRVSAAGDFNGDGFDDVIVSAPEGDDGGARAGEVYVVFGAATPGDIDLATLGSSQGVIIRGGAPLDRVGSCISSGGDVNGDGFDDLIIGTPRAGGTNAGDVYVVFGSASPASIDLDALTGAQGFTIQSDAGGDRHSTTVSSAGDVNGDGFDDLIVGAPYNDVGGHNDVGGAYVVFGDANPGNIDLTTMSPAQGFAIQGDAAYGRRTGWSVSSAGDVNGDGFADVLVGAPFVKIGSDYPGAAYVVFGASTVADVDLGHLSASQGFTIAGDANHDGAGYNVSAAGDVNGDGFDDVMVGAPWGEVGGYGAGQAYVILGGAFGLGSAAVATIGDSSAEMLIGGLGNDTLTGGGGADILRGGAGDDVLVVTDDFADIDGGTGYDTLRVDGSANSFDFSAIGSPEVTSIEAFDLTGSGNNSLALSALDLFHLSNDTSGGITRLTVHGNAGDSVSALDSGWVNAGTTSIDGEDYILLNMGNAQLIVDHDITLWGF